MSEDAAVPPVEPETGEHLTEVGTGLQKSVDLLRRALEAAEKKAAEDIRAAEEKAAADLRQERKDRKRSTRMFLIALAADIVLSLVGFGLWWGQHQANHRIEQSLRQNYVTAQQQVETRTRVLCPTETALLVLLSLPRMPSAPVLSAQQQDALTRAIQAFNNGYKALKCPPLPTVPAIPSG